MRMMNIISKLGSASSSSSSSCLEGGGIVFWVVLMLSNNHIFPVLSVFSAAAATATTTINSNNIGNQKNYYSSPDPYGVFPSSPPSSGVMNVERNMMTLGTSRNLKENGYQSSFDRDNHQGVVSIEDYRPFDPSPSSKASVRPGPIQHGTPLMPYIPNPKPSPPKPSDQDADP